MTTLKNIHNITYHLLEYVLEMTFNSQSCLISKEINIEKTSKFPVMIFIRFLQRARKVFHN
jgi:hypothetical protein